jgi:hypothetical protein
MLAYSSPGRTIVRFKGVRAETRKPLIVVDVGASASNGSHTLKAVARDTAGNQPISSPVVVTVVNGSTTPARRRHHQPCTVGLEAMLLAGFVGSIVSGTGTLAVTATDDVGVVRVQVRLDGVDLGVVYTAPPYVLTRNTVAVSNGCHTLTAIADDAAGNRGGSPPLQVTVNNP